MDFRAVSDALFASAAALREAGGRFDAGELAAEAYRDRAVQILEELSVTSPYAAELVIPRLEFVRGATPDKLAKSAGPLAEDVALGAQAIVENDAEGVRWMGP